MLGPVHAYGFHLKMEILLSSLAYRAKIPPGGRGGTDTSRNGLQVIKVVRKVEDEIIKIWFFCYIWTVEWHGCVLNGNDLLYIYDT